MKILVATDKFKGSLTSFEACNHIAEGIRLVDDNAEVLVFPMADGGEGFAAVLKYYLHTQTVTCKTVDPLMRQMDATYEWDSKGKVAIIELAAASGLLLLSEEERNPLKTSTFGTGILIQHAITAGAEKIILGVGGSATNDAGMGILAALGFKFLDDDGNEINPVGGGLQYLYSIIPPGNLPIFHFEIACDVTNILFGLDGAAYVYGAQKGAAKNDIIVLDNGLQNFAKVVQKQTLKDIAYFPGAGAAGGVAAGLMAYFEVSIKAGAEMILKKSAMSTHIKEVDLTITGEGKLDNQSLYGKVIGIVASLANQHQIPVLALCGKLAIDKKQVKEMGLVTAYGITDDGTNNMDAINNAGPLLKKLTEKAFAAFIHNSKA